MAKHQKHAKVPRPAGGNFHRVEWGILGAPCGVVKTLAEKLNETMQMSLVYVDEEHNPQPDAASVFDGLFRNRISHFDFSWKGALNEYSFRSRLRHFDAALINGNHYKAEKQIVIINSKKKESLQRKLDRLTDVIMVLLDEGEDEIYTFLKPLTESGVPVFKLNEIEKIAKVLKDDANAAIPKLQGMIFAGGKSSRMGVDKSAIEYHDKPMLDYAMDLLKPYCEKVVISTADPTSDDAAMADEFTGLGPYGGLLTWFRNHPDEAVLSLPVDAPLVDSELISELVSKRNPSKAATCFHNPETGFPEPLITIWEPRSYFSMLAFLAMGYSCPRKVLINSNIEELHTTSVHKLRNANTPEEREALIKILNSGS